MSTISIESLKSYERGEVFLKLLEDSSNFNSVYVNYETPHVRRLWKQLTVDVRLFLHEIIPCETPFYHPHPWMSVMRVLPIGTYEMALGRDSGSKCNNQICRLQFTNGGYYEMLDKNGWHYVKPIGQKVYSVVLTQRTEWKRWTPKAEKPLHTLEQAEKERILKVFHQFYKK